MANRIWKDKRKEEKGPGDCVTMQKPPKWPLVVSSAHLRRRLPPPSGSDSLRLIPLGRMSEEGLKPL